MSNFSKVGIFMKTFGQEVKNKPSFSTDKINKLRLDLIKEELSELTDAMNNKDLLEVADALTDILYVTYGAGHAFAEEKSPTIHFGWEYMRFKIPFKVI